MSENLFRIGGYYRQRNGVVVELRREHVSREGVAWARSVDMGLGEGFRALNGGRDTYQYEGSTRDLLPGELHQVNGAWVPIEDPELVALQTRPQHVEASCEEEKPAESKTPLFDFLRRQRERGQGPAAMESQRPPLPGYGQRTPFDPFSDFIVHHREEVSVNAKPFAGLTLDGCEQFRAPRSI